MNGVATQLFDPRLNHLFALRTPLLKALRAAGDTHTIQDVATGILSGHMQYWFNENAGIVTEVVLYPRKRIVNLFLVFGEMKAALALQPQIEQFARHSGCSALTSCGRHGWEKILPAEGWTRRWSVHTKALT